MTPIRILLITCILALVATLVFIRQQTEPNSSAPLSTQGGDFTLNSAEGPVSLRDFRGQAVVLYIGYTYCPDVCPLSLAILGQALKQLPEEDAARVQGLFISVDPERDSLEHLRDYARFFHPSLIGLTADKATLDQVVQQYGAFYRRVEMRDSAMEYAVDHSSRLYLINPKGELVGSLSHSSSPDLLLRRIQELLND
ncbi:SCO family protein [Nitrincola tapanii]|uniref:SCO family protein n=1 Tax=Nitrincola tapanii TaxID=1708751 RepID=A0A5A9W4I9_9GAMM|nr:SCO family protein [Nitrincola tapanii]KAA0875055.1 SCO family protein [Nitrincola tapanii]